jgi:hypothetical protein
MALGDQRDFVARLRALLPAKWFPITAPDATESATPILDGVLAGLASAWAWIWSFYTYANLQSRIATATDAFLDIIALDYFGIRIARKPGQPDEAFRKRILKEVVRERGTRRGLIQALTDLTGRAPIVFEPSNATDTGGYGFQGMTQGTGLAFSGDGSAGAGGWGSLALPYQCFVTAYRAHGGGIPDVVGFYTGSGWAGGGYGSGAIELGQLSMTEGLITDDDIDAAIVSVLPAATIAWTHISD